MKALIDQNIIHRDLKPENILLHDGVLKVVIELISKLTDFGMGRVLEGSQTF
jgi:serine/threonine protein kinase